MTIALTPEMKRIWNEIRPYLEWENGEMIFKEGTPEKIIEYKKKLAELWEEEECKTIELDEFGWGN